MQPYNLQPAQLDLFGSALQGMKAGEVLNQAGMQQKQQQQLFNQRQQTFENNQLKFRQEQEALQKNEIASANLNAALTNLSENPSKENVIKFAIKNPAYFEPMMKLTENMDADQEKKTIEKAFQMESLAEHNPEGYIAERRFLSEELLKSKDPEQVAKGRRIKYLTDAAQKNFDEGKLGAIQSAAALNSIGLVGPEKYAKIMESRGKLKKDTADALKATEEAGVVEQLADADTMKSVAALDQATASLMNAKIASKAPVDFVNREDSKMYSQLQTDYKALSGSLVHANKILTKLSGVDGKPLWKGGVLAVWSEKLKTKMGSELDKSEQLRKQTSLALKAMMTREAQEMRPEGSGSQSDAEFNAYMDTVPKPEDNGTTMVNWIRDYKDFKRREIGANKIRLKWMDKHNSSRGSKGGVKLIKGMPETLEGELVQEYLERTGYSFKAKQMTEEEIDKEQSTW